MCTQGSVQMQCSTVAAVCSCHQALCTRLWHTDHNYCYAELLLKYFYSWRPYKLILLRTYSQVDGVILRRFDQIEHSDQQC